MLYWLPNPPCMQYGSGKGTGAWDLGIAQIDTYIEIIKLYWSTIYIKKQTVNVLSLRVLVSYKL